MLLLFEMLTQVLMPLSYHVCELWTLSTNLRIIYPFQVCMALDMTPIDSEQNKNSSLT